jgi:enoyl-CoA hydratase/carnithine racemase
VHLLAETDGTVATFTLNRPERLNAVTPRMVDDHGFGSRTVTDPLA